MISKFKGYIVFLFFCFLLFFLVVFFIQGFRVKKIIIISDENSIKGLNVFSKKNMFIIDNEEIVPILLYQNIFIKDINIKKVFPNTLVLNPVWRRPVAQIISSEDPFLIDNDGYPARSFSNSEILPEIFVSKLIYNKNSADWRLVKAISLINNLKKYNLNLSKVAIDDDPSQISAVIDNSIEVFIPLNNDPVVTSASLQTIISRFRIEGKFISKIDLRFDKPIVILKNE